MAMSEPILSVAQIVPVTQAEGPGQRFALWFQGCPLRCPGCCNPEMLPFAGGMSIHLAEVVAQLTIAKTQHAIEGITLLGGEPFAHTIGAAALAEAAQEFDLSVMVFTGYHLQELLDQPDRNAHRLLASTDILVDGPYDREQPETKRRWIGSANQRVHFLSKRYSADDPRWRLPNTMEIRLQRGEVTVNGFPAPQAVGLWKRMV
jgi:anaerobic ribonucleoside-triphosphate reductase activating protein